MSDPFFSGPEQDVSTTTVPADPRYDGMRRVAKYQRWVLFSLLAGIIVNILFFSGVIGEDHPLKIPVNILSLFVFIFSIYAIFTLARELLGTGVAIACAILTVVPLAGLITLLVVNQKATKYLQRRGVHVGLMGADPKSI